MSLTNAPRLETERLILRGPEAQDFEHLVEFFANKERSWGFGGPKHRNDTWRWFAGAIGHWHLQDKGYWTIVSKDDNAVCGIVGIWNPADWPEAELGYVAFAGAEGKGIMFEAAQAARLHAYKVWGMQALPSFIMPGNTRSVALAERLGAVYEKTLQTVSHGDEMVYRHPPLEALL